MNGFEKYNVVYIDSIRYYNANLLEDNDYLNTYPYSLEFLNVKIKERSWCLLVKKLFNALECRNVKFFRGKISDGYKKNYIHVFDNIYLNTLLSSNSYVFIIKYLFKVYNIDLNSVKLIIKKFPICEDNLVKKYFKEQTMNLFKGFLMYEKGFNEVLADNIVLKIQSINESIVKYVSKVRYDLYLLDDIYDVSIVCNLIIKRVNDGNKYRAITKNMIIECISLYKEYVSGKKDILLTKENNNEIMINL